MNAKTSPLSEAVALIREAKTSLSPFASSAAKPTYSTALQALHKMGAALDLLHALAGREEGETVWIINEKWKGSAPQPPSPVPVEEEAIARVIDPGAFDKDRLQRCGSLTQVDCRQEFALTKARAILALLQQPSSGRA